VASGAHSIVGPADALSPEELEELRLLQERIQRDGRFNCAVYKDKCLRRRLMVRMRARGCKGFRAYAELLDRDAAELDRLLDTLTVNVTKFFRNPDTWDLLRETVVPALFDDRRLQPAVWSAGCASGEEPYSVAILLHEWARKAGRAAELRRCRIDGTDIDRASLEAAQRAVFLPHSLVDTPAAVRDAWFSAGPPFALRDEARRLAAFRRHDLVSEPAPGGYGLVLCRNVLIYFERDTQAELLQRFHDALVPGGFLVLGKAETLHGAARALFDVVSVRERIFRRRG
jgi:chemotaxis protein methyltransferase CheR